MIPEFPQFKPIELSDKEEVEKFTSRFPTYSDFNFFSMWGWDVNGNVKISQLNSNLIVIFSDYVSGDIFLSFIGNNKVVETTEKLLNFSKENYQKSFLKLVPEEVLLHFKGTNFVVDTDRGSFDYVYLVEHLANMDKWTKNTSGKEIRRFLKSIPNYKVMHRSVKDADFREYEEMFHNWAKSKNLDNNTYLNEYKAFRRFFETKHENLRTVSIHIENKMVGFSLYEILSKDYAISHFAKADNEFDFSICSLLSWEEARYLHSQGIKYFNWEQDLDIPGLRYSKTKYKPAFLLKKLIIKVMGGALNPKLSSI